MTTTAKVHQALTNTLPASTAALEVRTSRGGFMALTVRETAHGRDYATHWVDEGGARYSGHYFDTEAEARADLETR